MTTLNRKNESTDGNALAIASNSTPHFPEKISAKILKLLKIKELVEKMKLWPSTTHVMLMNRMPSRQVRVSLL